MEEYTQITLDDWVQMKERLKRDLIGIQESFVRIGYTLRRIEDQELYKQDGYKNITEFAKAEYGLKPSTVSRFKDINRKYSIDGYSDRLRPEFARFGSSKLSEMLSLPDQDMEMIKPEATRESIRELKRFGKEEPETGVADDTCQLIKLFVEENEEDLEELRNSEAYQVGNIKKMAEILIPSGDRVYKKGLYFMAMYKAEIKIKKYGSVPQTMSWEEFFTVARGIMEGQTTEKVEEAGSEEPEQTTAVTENKEEPMVAVTEDEEKSTAAVETDEEEAMAVDGTDKEKPMVVVTEDKKESVAAVEEVKNRKEKIAPAQENSEESDSESRDGSKENKEIEEKESGLVVDNPENKENTNDAETGETREGIQECADEPEPEEKKGEEATESIPEPAEDVASPEESQKADYMTRGEYLQTLTPYRMAHYIAEEYERHSLLASMLAYPSQLIDWLVRDVDSQGRDIVDMQ